MAQDGVAAAAESWESPEKPAQPRRGGANLSIVPSLRTSPRCARLS